MKKVLIGVGIGCGVLVILGIVAVVGMGTWFAGKVGGVVEVAETMEAQEKELTELDETYAFTPPAEGKLHKLTDERFQAWLRVNESAQAQLEAFEVNNKNLEAELNADDGKPSLAKLNKGMQAAGGMMTLMSDLRATMLTGLRKEKMSPREYTAIAHAVLGTVSQRMMLAAQESMDQARESMAKQREELEAKIADPETTAEQKEQLQAMLTAMEDGAGKLEAAAPKAGSVDEQLVLANGAVLDTYEDRMKKAANPVLLGIILQDGEFDPVSAFGTGQE